MNEKKIKIPRKIERQRNPVNTVCPERYFRTAIAIPFSIILLIN